MPRRTMGSNPTVTAKENPRETGGFLHSQTLRGAFLMHFSRNRGRDGCQCTRMRRGDYTDGGAKVRHLRGGSSFWASLITASGVSRPRSLSKATLNCAARMLRRTCRASSLRDAGSVRSFPSGVLKVLNGEGNRGSVSCARRTTASGVCRP